MDTGEITIRVYHDDGDFDVYAVWHGREVGYAWCLRDGNRLRLSDLKVKEASPPWPVFDGFLRRHGIHRRAIGMEGHGVGTLLLDRVVAEAETLGFEEIWGSVVPRDIDHYPRLLDWYEKRGFVRSPPDHESTPKAVWKITRKLGKM